MNKNLSRLNLIKNQLASNQKNQKHPNYIKCALTYLEFDDILTPEENNYRKQLREYLTINNYQKIVNEYNEKEEFPKVFWENLNKNFPGIIAGLSRSNKFPKFSAFSWAASLIELSRCDGNIGALFAVLSELCVKTLYLLGSEEQKKKYLDSLITAEKIAGWCLTEKNFGSDATNLNTSAEEVPGGYLINGEKRWIGNAKTADLLFVWAKNKSTKKVQCFLVEKNTKGVTANKIEGKLAVKAIVNADIKFENVFIPKNNKLEKANSFKDTNKILMISRLGICWIAVGMTINCYDTTIKYISEREQFGKKISAFQISQIKISKIMGDIQSMLFFSKRITEIFIKGELNMGMVSLLKAYNTNCLRSIIRTGRELFGGNGILLDYHIMKIFTDTEAIFTYEGTYDINSLVFGGEATGIKAFK
jgi:alkylation response protein AidB-like acyl-CoA dehydrogenase